MRESILFSKTIRNILSVFVTNAKRRFYLRQLCSLTGSSLRPVQLALRKLEKAGILVSQKEANIKFYSLNEQSPIYSEIKSIILKTEAIGQALSKGFKNLQNIQCAFIYGSVAKDAEKSSSDIDICVIGKVDLGDLSRVAAHLEQKFKREISTVTFSPEEWKRAVQGKKGFAMDILKNKKIALIGNLDEI
ncbi:MAG: nucleotidyltransferase domain-containing protein [Candidatus Omnitrophota bacterium]|nr:nucleotidyltransferase domain-containing protein [Candidatus Omnitrophota bacterium]